MQQYCCLFTDVENRFIKNQKIKVKKGFIRNALMMITGSTGAQLITIAASPLLARLYTPSDFGVLATFMSVSSIVGIFSTLRTERKVISERFDDKALSYYYASIRVAFFIALLSTIFVGFLSFYKYVNLPLEIIPLVFVFGFYYGILQSSTLLASRKGRFSAIVKSSFIRAIAATAFQLLLFFVLSGKEAEALVIGAILGLVFSALNITISADPQTKNKQWINGSKYAYQTIGFFRDAFYGGVQAFASTISNNMPTIMISTLGGYGQAGLYMMAERIVRMPINIISNNLRNVIAARIKENIEGSNKFIVKLSLILAFLGGICFAVFYSVSDWIFLFFMGDKWMLSSEISKIMFIWVVFNWFSLPYQAYNVSFGLMKNISVLEILIAVLKISCLYGVYYLGRGVIDAAMVITITSALYCVFHVVIYVREKMVL